MWLLSVLRRPAVVNAIRRQKNRKARSEIISILPRTHVCCCDWSTCLLRRYDFSLQITPNIFPVAIWLSSIRIDGLSSMADRSSRSKKCSQHPDQLELFKPLLRDESHTNFPGTIVRLALRRAESESRISSKEISPDEIHNLLVEFIKQEVDIAVLFLSHLTSVEVKEIGVDGREQILASATRTPQALQ